MALQNHVEELQVSEKFHLIRMIFFMLRKLLRDRARQEVRVYISPLQGFVLKNTTTFVVVPASAFPNDHCLGREGCALPPSAIKQSPRGGQRDVLALSWPFRAVIRESREAYCP